MTPFQNTLALLGRLALVLLFLPSGLGKVAGFAGITGYIASKGLPAPALLAALTIALEVLGALALLAGFKARWAAAALAVFTLLAGALFHNFWAVAPELAMAQQQAFFKNVGITGGLLLLVAFGAGAYSVDARTRP